MDDFENKYSLINEVMSRLRPFQTYDDDSTLN